MRVSYNKLWKLLIDKNMKKGELRDAIGASKSTFAKLGKNENVTLPVLLSIEYRLCKQIKDTLVIGTIISTKTRVFCFWEERSNLYAEKKNNRSITFSAPSS